jgi:hypothetical protein
MLTLLLLAGLLSAAQPPVQPPAVPISPGVPGPRLQVFLDCGHCFADYLREEAPWVDFVRDRSQADVHVIITNTGTGSGGREYVLAFIGAGARAGSDHTLKAVTGTGDPEEVRRRQVLTALRIGLLQYLAHAGAPPQLEVGVALEPRAGDVAASRADMWNSWVFSIRGSASMNAEESNREREARGAFGADRITPDWKLTFGMGFDEEREEFDLDEDDPVKVTRRERELNWLAVKSLGEHWSAGARGEVQSSTFDNTKLRVAAAPAIEYNYFPYSAYQRRQLRTQYSLGVQRQTYHEETLFGELEETLPAHEIAVTYAQRERWGAIQGEIEWFQYLHDLSRSRLEADGYLSWRILRGLSISANANASRIRDQLSLRRRGATPQEILLRLRELQSDYEYGVSVSLTYTFGSIFSSIVNPRFGQ